MLSIYCPHGLSGTYLPGDDMAGRGACKGGSEDTCGCQCTVHMQHRCGSVVLLAEARAWGAVCVMCGLCDVCTYCGAGR